LRDDSERNFTIADDFALPLRNVHLCVTVLQQHLHMEYISINLHNI